MTRRCRQGVPSNCCSRAAHNSLACFQHLRHVKLQHKRFSTAGKQTGIGFQMLKQRRSDGRLQHCALHAAAYGLALHLAACSFAHLSDGVAPDEGPVLERAHVIALLHADAEVVRVSAAMRVTFVRNGDSDGMHAAREQRQGTHPKQN